MLRRAFLEGAGAGILQIPLTQGKVALVDEADFDWLSQYKWHAHQWGARCWYAARMAHKNGKRALILMHKEVLKPPMGMETDHKDGDGLNNQRHNLRVATHAENQHNRRKRKGTTSRYKGVCWCRRDAKWSAQIVIDGKLLNLGLFTSEMDAARAYDRVAIKYFGDFSCLNCA